MKPLILVTLLALSLSQLPARDSLRSPARFHQARNVLVPLFASRESKPLACLRVDHIYPGAQRKGFFRVGLYPLLVCDRVDLEIGDASDASSSLEAANQWIQSVADPIPVELRHVSITVKHHPGRLRAARACPTAAQGWQLSDVSVQVPGQEVRIPEATLQMGNGHTGRLEWMQDQQLRHLDWLVSPLPTQATSPDPQP